MENNDLESTLLKMIGKFQRLVDEFNKNSKKNISVVLLVGLTGSGKSTIFNFLSGADFIINENKELLIKNPSNKFSKMIGGMNSVTKEPNFYHNTQNNHLIIDFPGFQDTNGEWDQLLFELLFYKIVTQGPIKVIYVIKNPENSLPNRGSDLQEFIKQVFLKGNVNIQKFNLLLNCYLEDLSDEQLSNKIKDDLKSVNLLQQIDKIPIIRKAKKIDELQLIFNDQQRQILWQQIEQMQAIKILPQKLPKSEIISDYLRSTTLKTIEKYGAILCDVFDNSYLKLSERQSQTTYQSMLQLLQVIKRDNRESPLNWYANFISICEKLAYNLSAKSDIINSSNNFKQIFIYFSQFSNLIKGYDEMTIIKSIAEDQLKKIEKLINTRLEFLQKAQEDRARICQIENQKQELQVYMKNYKYQLEQLENRIENSQEQHQEEMDQLRSKLEKAKDKYSQLRAEKYEEQEEQNKRYIKQIQRLKKEKEERISNQYKREKEDYEKYYKRETDIYERKTRQQEDQINNMEKKIDNLQKQLYSRSKSSSSDCQIF